MCGLDILSGEQVFYGSQVSFDGPSEYDFSHLEASCGLSGSIHMSCLQNPAEAKEVATEETSGSMVQRSNALAILDI